MKSLKLVTLTCLVLLQAGPAMAWKPLMHEYLADQVYNEVIAGGGTLQVNHIWHSDGEFQYPLPDRIELSPLVYQALLDHPAQYRAGVLGPDAYPDLITGQSVIHPDDDQPGAGQGANAWLDRLWRAAYQEALTTGHDEPLAFMAGFLTHAAGDMYAHTFVNAYAHGAFEFGDNAATHVVVEGYVAKSTPALPLSVYTISIDGVEEFIYRELIDATRYPRTEIYDLYVLKDQSVSTIPRIFGEYRSALEMSNDAWRALSYPSLKKIAEAPVHAYRKAWQADIDRGLRRLPTVSTQAATHLFFNPSRRLDSEAADRVLNDYFYDYMISMFGAPDAFAEFTDIVTTITSAVTGFLHIPDPFAVIKDWVIDYHVEKATGLPLSTWKGLSANPEKHIIHDKQLVNANKACGPSAPVTNGRKLSTQDEALLAADPSLGDCKNEIELKMSLDANGLYQWQRFTPAFNTVLMSKLLLLGAPGHRGLMGQLGYPESLPMGYSIQPGQPLLSNAMVGFMRSLDDSRQWSAHSNQMMAHFDCHMYGQVFADQKGARTGATALSYVGGQSTSRGCPVVSGVHFDRGGLSTENAVCASDLTATVYLDKSSDSHGAVVEVATSGPIFASPMQHVAAGSQVGTINLRVGAVEVEQDIQIDVSRVDGSGDTATWRVRPPFMDLLRAQRRQVGGYVNVFDGDRVLGATDLLTEGRLDCTQASATSLIEFDACPLQGPGVCVSQATSGELGTKTYRTTLALPPVQVDTLYRVTGTFINTSESMDITVLSSRVLSVTLERESVNLGFGSTAMTATLKMNGPATGAETVFLRYDSGLTGPASVVIATGQDALNFTVTAQPSLLINQCVATVGWVEAISAKDAASAGLNTGRERYAEVIMEQNDGFNPCMEMMHPDPRW